jgi:hypothetical protein
VSGGGHGGGRPEVDVCVEKVFGGHAGRMDWVSVGRVWLIGVV